MGGMKSPCLIVACSVAVLVGVSLGSVPCAAEEVVSVGSGGYLTTRPKPCKALPETIYRTRDLTGPMLTGQWWSSLVFQKHSQPLFAHPLAMQCKDDGLAVWYPGSKIFGNKDGIFGIGSGKNGDLLIGLEGAKFTQADCGGFSDWFVTAVFADGEKSLRTSFGHGSPFVYCETSGADARITFSGPVKMWSNTGKSVVIGLTVNGHHYGFFAPSDATLTKVDQNAWSLASRGKGYFSIALLPDDQQATLELFAKYAHNHVVDTRVEYQVQGGSVKSTYQLICKPREGKDIGTLFALYPHQWKYATTKLTDLGYGSVRGAMKLGEGHNFVTETPIQGVLPMFPAGGIADRERMRGYLREEADKKEPGYGDTYWEGKHLGNLATLAQISEVAGEKEFDAKFRGQLKKRLEDWFTAKPGKDQPIFYYNATWGTLIGSRPSYGSDNPINDHHFHYGYFIRAAAEVARRDPAWAKEWGPMVELLIRDIASPNRGDKMFPYLRCFDKYAGHSWASGDANFADGNNQESSSESMNAWYGMILWGEATGKRSIRDAGLYLFNTERTAVEEYWFDVEGTNYPKDFPQVALGMCWGGKGAFATWFSADIDCIHGINWLPFTPASIYMGRHPDYVRKNHERIVEKRKGGRDYNNGWGDLVVMFSALADPAPAAKWLEANPRCKLEGGNSHAFMYHWIETLNRLGTNDAGVSADHPIANVFQKNGKKTYAAYNFDSQPITVTFSDGTKLIAAPGKLTTQ